MITTHEALKYWKKTEYGYSMTIANIEICLEELIFDEQWYLAIYKKQELVTPKVVVKLGKE